MVTVMLILISILVLCMGGLQFYLAAHNTNKLFTYLAAIYFVLSFLIVLTISAHTREQKEFNDYKETYKTVATTQKTEIKIPDYYYQGAELLEQIQLYDGTYQVQFCVYGAPGPIYLWTNESAIDEDGVFLLTMKSNGTTNLLDDEVVVVWKSVN
jgi:hypothetical protein